MKVLHVSPIYNRESILKEGIVPTHVKNENHRDAFIEDGVCSLDGKAIYTWLDSEMNEKLIRDFIYAVVWIHPRNEIGEIFEERYNDGIDFKYDHRKPIYPYNQMLFDVYLAESHKTESDYIHEQYPKREEYDTCHKMNGYYAHDFKELVIHDKPLTDIKIIGSVMYFYDAVNNSIFIK